MPNARYAAAIARNLSELQRAKLNRTAMLAIEKEHATGHGIFRIAYFALFNDYIAHAMKVFEGSQRVASFWYLCRTDRHLVDAFLKKTNVDLNSLYEISRKLKIVRDQTHFHIDKDAVLNPKEIWKTAGLKGRELSDTIDLAWNVVCHLQNYHALPEVGIPPEFKLEKLRKQVRE